MLKGCAWMETVTSVYTMIVLQRSECIVWIENGHLAGEYVFFNTGSNDGLSMGRPRKTHLGG